MKLAQDGFDLGMNQFSLVPQLPKNDPHFNRGQMRFENKVFIQSKYVTHSAPSE